MQKKILVIEDEISINDILTSALRAEGYSVRSAFTGNEARNIFKLFQPDIALLDINLPDESGFDLCKYISQEYFIPIIILTARTDIFDKVLGLELGADDYITKPFHIKEVVTRIKIALRRIEKYNTEKEPTLISLNENIKINYSSRTVYKDNAIVKLKPKEYDLLEFLSKNKNQVFSRTVLLNQVWGLDYEGDERTVDVHVRRLRSKLDNVDDKSIIDTVFSIGYVMRYYNEN
ncbi:MULTISPECIES: response regulator transcription factor [Clostridium]|uniref:response regulator transcription factor n=1 Tax=Clostridium TaxID=1485 RepID=UPI000C07287C|nr:MULTISPECIES: response regulator transcription factor [Clostridium]MBS6887921.1 response regulator transcription factor [Clostridium sp.]MDU4143654.1 response regulator transcription factor [Clostridium sp.]